MRAGQSPEQYAPGLLMHATTKALSHGLRDFGRARIFGILA